MDSCSERQPAMGDNSGDYPHIDSRRSNKLQIRNLPPHTSREAVEGVLSSCGLAPFQRCELVSGNMETSVHVTYESPDYAQQACDRLNNYDFDGSLLKVELLNGRNNKGRPRNNGPGNGRGTGFPVRILVLSEYVGAIIGKRGQTIRNITQQSRARVDVHRKENSGLLEKVISIYGGPENCSNACKEILRVMQQEALSTNRGEVALKMLADDRYCGRIIGKDGKVIKKMREDTDTKITVSNVQDAAALFPDRVITIRGSLENMSQAESAISAKLRECYEKEMQAPMHPNMMMPSNLSGMGMMGAPPIYGMRGPYGIMQNQQSGFYPGSMGGYGQVQQHQHQHQQTPQMPQPDESYIFIPNTSVGAVIGSGGSNIKQIIRDSNAFVTIEPKKDTDPNPATERTVTIKGTPEAIWKATFYIFEKLKAEGFAGHDEVRLRTGLKVPKSMVGKVIGKGGKNVREVQRLTGSLVKLPEDQADQGDEVLVEVLGNFMATQTAQSRVRALAGLCGGHIPGGPGGPMMPPPPPPSQQPQRRRGPPPPGPN